MGRPVGVHLKDWTFEACGYLYYTDEIVDDGFFPLGTVHQMRCDGCGRLFDSTDFMDHDLIRGMDDLEKIDCSGLPALD